MLSLINTIKLVKPLQRQIRTFFRIIPAYEKGVKFTLGKLTGTVDAGLRLKLPCIQKIHRVDIRDRIDELTAQQLITANGVTIVIDGAVEYKIVNVEKAIMNVSDVSSNVQQKCLLELRSELSSKTHDFVLQNRDAISNNVVAALRSKFSEEWGVELKNVRIKNIELNEQLKRALAVSAEATKNAEAKIINAEADIKTAELYKKAAEIYAENPVTLRLREFQLWSNIAKDPNSKFFVIPSNIADFIKKN